MRVCRNVPVHEKNVYLNVVFCLLWRCRSVDNDDYTTLFFAIAHAVVLIYIVYIYANVRVLVCVCLQEILVEIVVFLCVEVGKR